MADPIRPDPEEGTANVANGDSPRGMPRWVKVVGIVVGLGILLLIVVMMVGGVEHGPQLHGAGADTAADHADDAPPIEGAPQIAVSAGELRFDPDRLEVPAGLPINVALASTDIFHDLVVDEIDFHLGAEADDTAVGGLVFDEPGTYVAYCSVPGHREAGMELEVVVGDHGDMEDFFRDLHG
jgi:nitrite reductase (NO-forming)